MYNRYSSLQQEDNDKEMNCYSINSIKQLKKKLKYSKEKYYCTLSNEDREKVNNIKIKIITIRGIKSKYIIKDFITYEKQKHNEKVKKEKQRKLKRKKAIEKLKRKKEAEKKLKMEAEKKLKMEEERKKIEEEKEKRRKEKEEYYYRKEQERRRKMKEEWKRKKGKKNKEYYRKENEKEEKSIYHNNLNILNYSDIPEDIKNYYNNPNTKTYRKLSKIYHPDKGGNSEFMKIINNIRDNNNKTYLNISYN